MMSCETYHFLIHHDTTRSLINKLVVSKDTFVTVLMFLILALLMPRGETLIPTIVTFKAPSLLLLATTLAQLLHCFLDVEESRLRPSQGPSHHRPPCFLLLQPNASLRRLQYTKRWWCSLLDQEIRLVFRENTWSDAVNLPHSPSPPRASLCSMAGRRSRTVLSSRNKGC